MFSMCEQMVRGRAFLLPRGNQTATLMVSLAWVMSRGAWEKSRTRVPFLPLTVTTRLLIVHSTSVGTLIVMEEQRGIASRPLKKEHRKRI
eukprot:XP_001705796.1 Hypothetical protein GL50803_32037 [Giardia lamblia ATCC 50803]